MSQEMADFMCCEGWKHKAHQDQRQPFELISAFQNFVPKFKESNGLNLINQS